MVDRFMVTRTIKSKAIVGILALVLMLAFIGVFAFFGLGPGWLYPRDVSVRELHEHPSAYVGQQVKAIGYLVKHTAPHFGDTYNLCEGDPRNLYFAVNPCISVSGESPAIESFASLIYNGTSYEVRPCPFVAPCRVVVSGVFIDRGPVIDASQYVIEASSAAWLVD